VVTRTANEDAATRLEYDGNGRIASQAGAAREVGTTIELRNLFHSLPVRLQEFHRALKREYHKLLTVLQAYAVISTGVRLTVTHATQAGSKSTVLTTNARGLTMSDNIADVFGAKCCELLQSFALDVGDAHIGGFVSRPMHGSGRSAGDRQFLYINRRPVDLPRFTRTANEAYRLLNKKQYPQLFLNVTLPTDAYDVNVTPNKREIMLHSERELLDALKTSLDALYQPNEMTYVDSNASTSTARKPRRVKDFDSDSDSDDAAAAAAATAAAAVADDGDDDDDNDANEKSVSSDFASQKRRQSVGSQASQSASQAEPLPPPPPPPPVSNPSSAKRSAPPSDAKKRGSSSLSALNDLLAEAEFAQPASSSKRRPQLARRDSAPLSLRPPLSLSPSPPSSPFVPSEPQVPSSVVAAAHHGDDHAHGHDDDDEAGEDAQPPQQLVYVSDAVDVGEPTPGESGVIGADVTVTVAGGTEGLLARFRSRCAPRQVPQCAREDGAAAAAAAAAAGTADDGAQVRFFSKIAADSDAECTRELERVFRKSFFAQMQIVGQFNLGFIIARLGKDVFIVDQHATDEKFNYERLAATTVLQTQALIAPRRLELTPQEEDIVIDNVALFSLNGFQFRIDQDAPPRERVKLVGRPFSKATEFGVSDIQEMIFLLNERPGEHCRPSRIYSMLASRACRSSVMIGTALTLGSMQNIVRRMADMKAPWSCPHGRPTMRHLFDRARLPVPLVFARDR
jgi:DNA mismatch repair protein PMS2